MSLSLSDQEVMANQNTARQVKFFKSSQNPRGAYTHRGSDNVTRRCTCTRSCPGVSWPRRSGAMKPKRIAAHAPNNPHDMEPSPNVPPRLACASRACHAPSTQSAHPERDRKVYDHGVKILCPGEARSLCIHQDTFCRRKRSALAMTDRELKLMTAAVQTLREGRPRGAPGTHRDSVDKTRCGRARCLSRLTLTYSTIQKDTWPIITCGQLVHSWHASS